MTWTEEAHMGWNIINFLNDTWSNLSNVHINKKTIISIYFLKFFWSQLLGINIMLNIAVLMRKNNIRVSIFVTWGFKINNFKVFLCFLSVKAKEKAGVGSNFTIRLFLELSKLFLAQLVFETKLSSLLFK
jgi:hypothetical protein